jgi:Arc/MetJ family transcription regulator
LIVIVAKHAHESHPLAQRFTTTEASIDIDEELLPGAQATRVKTKRAVVHAALELWVRHLKQDQALRRRTRGIRRNEWKG